VCHCYPEEKTMTVREIARDIIAAQLAASRYASEPTAQEVTAADITVTACTPSAPCLKLFAAQADNPVWRRVALCLNHSPKCGQCGAATRTGGDDVLETWCTRDPDHKVGLEPSRALPWSDR